LTKWGTARAVETISLIGIIGRTGAVRDETSQIQGESAKAEGGWGSSRFPAKSAG
jgi:hypothetical protein